MKTKPQTSIRIASDNLEVVYGNETYRPHEGEWVEFKGRPSVGLYLVLMDPAQMLGNGMDMLAQQIKAWNWTDDSNEPYQSPPTPDTLRLLPKEELAWLLKSAGAGAPDVEQLKNGTPPSISL